MIFEYFLTSNYLLLTAFLRTPIRLDICFLSDHTEQVCEAEVVRRYQRVAVVVVYSGSRLSCNEFGFFIDLRESRVLRSLVFIFLKYS